MGIKGIYRELGPGQRVSLAKLAVDHLEDTGRPLRLAIDIAIWQFQTQAARGGTNPAIRTLFYRLVRLLGLSIQPVFVFDGPHKPMFKRNKRSGRGDGVATAMAKRLIKLFGFPIHQAPGEAEAECALLQQQAVVDVVLSEDVDTIMFGCTRTIRNWTAEGNRGAKAPTHVTMYDVNNAEFIKSGLDREGMVLVALMSGGDYIPEGVPGCGVKLACEAAKAGFGKSLCGLKLSETSQLASWRDLLKQELRTNKSGFFRTKHKALVIPDGFPDMQTLRYYTHPVVSDTTTIETLRDNILWNSSVNITGLRGFVDEVFDWSYKGGAIKLIRVLSPSLLAQQILQRYKQPVANDNLEIVEREEHALVRAIVGKRSHFSVDGLPEFRVSHVPSDIVPIDLSNEEEEVLSTERQGLALNSDDDFEIMPVISQNVAASDTKTSKVVFDPTASQLVWLPESLVKLGIPLTVEDWEETQRERLNSKGSRQRPQKTQGRTKATPLDSSKSMSLDSWVKTAKPAASRDKESGLGAPKRSLRLPEPLNSSLASATQAVPGQSRSYHTQAASARSKPPRPKSMGKTAAVDSAKAQNPWAIAGSHRMPRITKPTSTAKPILISSSPEHASSTPTRMTSLESQTSAASQIKARSINLLPTTTEIHDSTQHSTLVISDEDSPCPATKVMAQALTQTTLKSFVRPSESPSLSRPSHRQGQVKSMSYDEPSATEQPILPVSPREKCMVGQKLRPLQTENATQSFLPTLIGSGAGDDLATPRTTTKKVFMPRSSALGLFKEVEINAADTKTSTNQQTIDVVDDTSRGRGKRRDWRLSRVSLIDLTGDDE